MIKRSVKAALVRRIEMGGFHGFALKRASLRQRFPHLSEHEIDERLAAWLTSDG